MSDKRKNLTSFCLMLLLISTAAMSLFGTFTEPAVEQEHISSLRQTHSEQENICENLPYTPSATFRFAGRQNRPAAPSSRIRPWTPAEITRHTGLINAKFPPSVTFELPDNVSAVCTAHCLCTSPVRAGPEPIFFT